MTAIESGSTKARRAGRAKATGEASLLHSIEVGSGPATFFYARTSTAEQTIEHQVKQAEASGFKIDHVLSDHGVSGVSTCLKERPQGKRLFDLMRAGDVLVVRWVDRLGRNYVDVSDSLRDFMRRGVVVKTIINGMVFDGATTDPVQQAVRDALIAFMAATAQAQAEATKEAQRAGIAHARENSPDAFLGRKPSYDRKQVAAVATLLDQGVSPSEVAREVGLSRQTVYRIKDNPVKAEALLTAWGL